MNTALIVEDLPDIRQWLAHSCQLAYPGLEIYSAAHVRDAMALTRQHRFDLALVDLGLPDGSGIEVLLALRDAQPRAVSIVVTIYDDDDHLFPALQAGAYGYVLKELAQQELVAQLHKIARGEPPLSPAIARRLMLYFTQAQNNFDGHMASAGAEIVLSKRENEVLLRISKGYTLIETASQLNLSRHTVGDHVKQIYRKLGISSRAEAATEAMRRGIVI